MKVHHYEKAFLAVGVVLLVVCAGALVYASVGMGMHLPGHVGKVDPQALASTPPFDNPGVRQVGDQAYEAVIVAQMWSFSPAEITVPAGAQVTFIGTTADVIHGFHIDKTRVNLMLIPGQIARATYTFATPGEHLLVCHEYCGLAHHTMYGKVTVK